MYDHAYDFYKGYAIVEKDDVDYHINKNFQIVDEVAALRVAEQDLGIINEIAPECFLVEGFSEALDEIIHKHYTQKIKKTTSPDDVLKIKDELEKLNKLLESKKQEAKELEIKQAELIERKKQEAKKLEQARTDAQETLDKLFGNLNEKE